MLRFSDHARRRMADRQIDEIEVEQAMSNPFNETSGKTSDRVNIWGATDAGRRLRITTYRTAREFIITVVAPDEDQG